MLIPALQLISGIALFIFAMGLAEDSLREMAGRQFKKFLQKNVNTTFKSLSAGTIVTGILQSSSVVALMTLSFVGAGLINMRNALALTLGANLGTTFDSWLIAVIGFKFDLLMFAYPLVILAVGLQMSFRKLKLAQDLSKFLVGFAMLFLGLEWMKDSAAFFVQHFDLSHYANHNVYWFIVFGFIVTVIIQSSSALTAITLTALYHQLIPFENAIGILVGSELGTTIKVFIGSIGGIPDKKRVALGNLYFNLALLFVSTLFIHPISEFLYNSVGRYDPLIGLVTFQTGINLLIILLFYPFMGKIGTYLEQRFTHDDNGNVTRYIQKPIAPFAEEALLSAQREIKRFMAMTQELNAIILGVDNRIENQSWIGKMMDRNEVDEKYQELKVLQGSILEYLVEMRDKYATEKELEKIGQLIGVTRNIMHAAKKVKDIGHNIQDLENSADDNLYDLLTQIKIEERNFMDLLNDLQNETEPAQRLNRKDRMLEDNERQYNLSVNNTLTELDKGNIREIDSSTLLNIYRAVHSSHQSMLEAVEDI